MLRPAVWPWAGRRPSSFLVTSKACPTPSCLCSFRDNETRRRRLALLQSTRNGTRFESILKTYVSHLLPKFRILERLDVYVQTFRTPDFIDCSYLRNIRGRISCYFGPHQQPLWAVSGGVHRNTTGRYH